jgi:uncharacterized repeat protein (TIGR03803 family)
MCLQHHLGRVALASIAGCIVADSAAAAQFERLHAFTADKGMYVQSRLIEGSDGNFYGLAREGGAHGAGTAFRITPEGGVTKLHDFVGNFESPRAGLVEGPDGNFYGTTRGSIAYGTVFRLSPTGVLATIAQFDGTNGTRPVGALIVGSDGALYGRDGGDSEHAPTIFRMTLEGALSTVATIPATEILWNGCNNVVQALDGSFYGASERKFFRATAAGVVEIVGTLIDDCQGDLIYSSDGGVYGFAAGTDGVALFRGTSEGITSMVPPAAPAGVTEGSDGFLYFLGGSEAYRASMAGLVVPFGEFDPPIAMPSALLEASDGNFYGAGRLDVGRNSETVYRLTPTGEVTELATFRFETGAFPNSALVLGGDGSMYGTTSQGGAFDRGVVYRRDASGDVTALASFESSPGEIIVANDGNVYGAITEGVDNWVFKLTPAGTVTRLATLDFNAHGMGLARMVQGADGNFYGSTYAGGPRGGGTVLRLTPAGALTVLVAFNHLDEIPGAGALIAREDGGFYGFTGIQIVRISPEGALTIVHSFSSSGFAGGQLAEDTKGNVYGVADDGVFRLGSDGRFEMLTAITESHKFFTRSLAVGTDEAIYAGVFQHFPDVWTLVRIAHDGSTSIAAAGTRIDGFVLGQDGSLYGVEPGPDGARGGLARLEPDVPDRGGGGSLPPCSLLQLTLLLLLRRQTSRPHPGLAGPNTDWPRAKRRTPFPLKRPSIQS